jgi:tetratricopeptide (TPR) repeat protein
MGHWFRLLGICGLVLVLAGMFLPARAEHAGDAVAQAAEEKEKQESLAWTKWETEIELACTYKEAQKTEEALVQYRKALDFVVPEEFSAERRNEALHQKLHLSSDLADLLMEQKKDPTGAIDVLKCGLALAEKLPADDPTTKEKKIHLYKRIGSILRETGKPADAIEYLKKAQEIQ